MFNIHIYIYIYSIYNSTLHFIHHELLISIKKKKKLILLGFGILI
jgi:hypothetical protein